MRVARAVFYFEAFTNLVSAAFAMVMPAAFLAQFVSEPLPAAGIEFGRWYAVLLIVLSLVLLAALREGSDRFLRPVMGAYLLGDALQIAVAIRLGSLGPTFGLAVHAAVWTSVLYAAVRIYYLSSTRPR